MINLFKQYKENKEFIYNYLLKTINVIILNKETNKNSNSFNGEYELFINTKNNKVLFNNKEFNLILKEQYNIEKEIIKKEKKYLLNNIKKINKKEEAIKSIIEDYNLNVTEIKTLFKYAFNLITLDWKDKIKLNKKIINSIKNKIEKKDLKEILKDENSILEINIVQNIDNIIKKIINYKIFKYITLENDFFREKIIVKNYIKADGELNNYIKYYLDVLNKENLKFKELNLDNIYNYLQTINIFLDIIKKERSNIKTLTILNLQIKEELINIKNITKNFILNQKEILYIEIILNKIEKYIKDKSILNLINNIKKNLIKKGKNKNSYKIINKEYNFIKIIFLEKIKIENIQNLIQDIFNKNTQILINK